MKKSKNQHSNYSGNSQEKFTTMFLATMRSDAWRALSPTAQALYVWLKLEWNGPKNNNNGKLFLSARDSAKKMGVSPNTAAKAQRELQAKGFIEVLVPSQLGVAGKGTAHVYRLTEVGMPRDGQYQTPCGLKHLRERPSREYGKWKRGHDFPIVRGGNSHAKKPKANEHSRARIDTRTSQNVPKNETGLYEYADDGSTE